MKCLTCENVFNCFELPRKAMQINIYDNFINNYINHNMNQEEEHLWSQNFHFVED